MWAYEKKLQYPVNIKNTDPKMAKVIISQLGGADCKKLYRNFIKNLYVTSRAVVHYPLN